METRERVHQKRVAVAMSGGVDSAVATALLVEQGYDVIGVTMRLYNNVPDEGLSSVCGDNTYIEDARRVAAKLGVPHHVVDLRQEFLDEVVKVFAASYAQGETPNPCAVCNRKIKFGTLLNEARKLGFDKLATGHYARIIEGKDGQELHCGKDETRDQGYFLFGTPRELLAALCFPLGDLTKTETRAMAERFKIPVSEKPDSQDICFVPEDDYTTVVRRFDAEAFRHGEIVDEQGYVLGRHEGIINFTIGQRRGLSLSDRIGDHNDPLFVLRLEPETHRVVVGPRTALASKTVFLREVNWLGDDVPENGIDVSVRLRSTMMSVPARYFAIAEDQGRINLSDPVFGVAPGQAGVIYDGSRILGGGWINQPF